MGVGEYLGWVTTLLSDLGLTSYVIALAVVSVSVVLLQKLFDRG